MPAHSQVIVVGIAQVKICSFTFLIPSILFTTQKKLSLKYENTSDPVVAANAAKTIFTSVSGKIGAEIAAAVIIAKVPLP